MWQRRDDFRSALDTNDAGNRVKCESDLSDVLQHGHASQLLLDGAVVVNLASKLGSVGGVIHLMKIKQMNKYR